MENINGKTLNTIIDFDFVVNTDLGLIRYIRNNYRDERVFNIDVLDKSDREILSLLSDRIDPNPLSIVSTEDNMDSIDKLYKSFFDSYKKEIIDSSISENKIVKFISLMTNNGNSFGINNYIAIADDIERESMESRFHRLKFITKEESSVTAIKSLDSFVVRDYLFFTSLGLDDLRGKKICISPRNYNVYFFSRDDKLSPYNKIIFFGKDYRTEKLEEMTYDRKSDTE